jgi:hypothetical protein
MKYVIDDEELEAIVYPFALGTNTTEESLKKYIHETLKSKTPVEEIAEGCIDDICRQVGLWSCYKFNKKEYKCFIQEVIK